jgi:transcriptional regulator with XRE-family HTH domain
MNLPIGENIKRLRIEAGLTQRALAYELGVSIQAVSKWEQSRSYPDLDLIPKIAQLLGVGIDALFESAKSSAGEKEKAM